MIIKNFFLRETRRLGKGGKARAVRGGIAFRCHGNGPSVNTLAQTHWVCPIEAVAGFTVLTHYGLAVTVV